MFAAPCLGLYARSLSTFLPELSSPRPNILQTLEFCLVLRELSLTRFYSLTQSPVFISISHPAFSRQSALPPLKLCERSFCAENCNQSFDALASRVIASMLPGARQRRAMRPILSRRASSLITSMLPGVLQRRESEPGVLPPALRPRKQLMPVNFFLVKLL